MNAKSFTDPGRRGDAHAPPTLPCDPACSDAELYDLLFHYHRVHAMLKRYRSADAVAQVAVERVLVRLEAEARRRGIPLHRLPV